MAITIDDFSKIWASTSPLTPYQFSENNYKSGWNFIGSTPPSRQMWDFLQKNNDEKMQYLANNYLPLSGGTLTGEIHLPNGAGSLTAFSSGVYFSGNNPRGDNSSNLILYADSNANGFMVQAGNGTNRKRLIGKPDGTFTWDGQPIQTSSDKRLKQDFSVVPADVLESWSKVEWKQFKYIADKERKGDSCRWHTGLVAQDVQDVCGDKILKYGILCHDVKEATEDSEAVDLWTIRYEEALAMEVIYLRNEIKKLREEIKALRTE